MRVSLTATALFEPVKKHVMPIWINVVGLLKRKQN